MRKDKVRAKMPVGPPCDCMKEDRWLQLRAIAVQDLMDTLEEMDKHLCTEGMVDVIKAFIRESCGPLADVSFLREIAAELEADIAHAVQPTEKG